MILLKVWELRWLGLMAGTAGAQTGSPGRWNWRVQGKPEGRGSVLSPGWPAGMLFHGFLWDLCLFGIGDCVERLSCGSVRPRSPARESGISLTTTFGENLNNLRLFLNFLWRVCNESDSPPSKNTALSTQLCCLLHPSSLLGISIHRSALTACLGVKIEISVLVLVYRSHLACVHR